MIDFKTKPIFAMIHLAGDDAYKRADEEITMLEEEGVDGCIIENYHSTIASVRQVLLLRYNTKSNFKVGINILPNEYELSFAFSDVYNLDFIQLDYVAGRYKDTNQINLQNYLKFKAKYPNTTVLGGVHPKYYFPVDGSILKHDIEIGMMLAHAIVVTGSGTGKETPIDKIMSFREVLGNHPLIIGAGLNPSNVEEQLKLADGAIVGSCLKKHGITTNPIDRTLVREFMDAVKKARQ